MQPPMNELLASDINERLEIWPLRLTVGGVAGWTLWFGGSIDVLLARHRRVQLFATLEALRAAVISKGGEFTPERVTGITASDLDALLATPARPNDLDAAAAWFALPDAASTLEDCSRALDAMNMATDIGATAGDQRFAHLAASEPLCGILDVLTYGLTFIGNDSPFHRDPGAMVRAMTSDARAVAARLVALAAEHVEVG